MSQSNSGNQSHRGSIPEELFRPRRGESPRYPIDTVIGELGRGTVSQAAFTYANSIGNALLTGQAGNPVLASIDSITRRNYLSAINIVNPVSFRIGGARELPDGTISFLVRFLGREQGITGEMYIRSVSGNWILDELYLDEARYRDNENQDAQRGDFFPYERFY